MASLATLIHDLRFGARILARTPLVTISIIALLGFGIGANSAMFGIVDALILHPVRYEDPQSIAFLWSYDAQGTVSDASAADFLDWRRQSKTLDDLAAWMPTSVVATGGGRPRQVGAAAVTANFFKTLGVKPALGRTFLPGEDGLDHPENATRSVIVSYRFWQEDLGADPNVLGRTLGIDSRAYTVIGVAPKGFQFWWRPHDLWFPVSLNVHDRDFHDLVVIGRLRTSRERAAAEMAVIARSLARAYPKSDKGWTIHVDGLGDWLLNGTFRTRLFLLSAAVGLVLLIACMNVAGLMLARSAVRTREIAVRMSLGATRWHLIGQLLTESALLTLGGAALGLAIASVLIRIAPKIVPANAIPGGPLEVSGPVAWFTLAISAATCLLFGLAPAIAASSGDVQTALKDFSRGTTSGRKGLRFRQGMVAAEVAVALILLTTTWLMTSSLRELTHADAGFDPKNVLTMRIYLPPGKYDAAHLLGFCRLGLERIAALPGVKSVTAATTLAPLSTMEVRFLPDGMPERDESEQPSAPYAAVSPAYFRTLGVPLKRGREFTEADREKAPLVAIVNDAYVSRFSPDRDPIDRRMVVNRPLGSREEAVSVEVVGVVGNVRLNDLADEARPMIYVPFPQNVFARAIWFAARTKGDPLLLSGTVRKQFQEIDREQPLEQVGSLEATVDAQFAQPRFQIGLMTSFALIALLLASIGIYGVNAYMVAQRRNEIGVRMALGATPAVVLREVIGLGMRLVAIGVVAGVAGAEAIALWLKTVLVGAGRTDLMAFVGAALLLAAVAALACYLPARKAMRIDPAIALRSD